MLSEGALQLRIDSRADGQPRLIDTTSLEHGLVEANRLIAAYRADCDRGVEISELFHGRGR